MKIRFLYIVVLCLSGMITANGQELLLPLKSNALKQHHLNTGKDGVLATEKSTTTNTENIEPQIITLPFWDDFSYDGPYPDAELWADQYVFINNSYAIHPKTTGVATFDAINQHGIIYDHIEASNTPYAADLLTSHAIRLDSLFSPSPRKLNPADSVLLSFYYQPQGNAGNPLFQDSLVLEFLLVPGHYILNEAQEEVYVDDVWASVWRATGERLEEFTNDTFPFFKRVTIPIIDEAYFRSDFRFRFKNHASFPLSGNPTLQNNTGSRVLWNIDYVYLNHSRNTSQTSYFDLAFASLPQSILLEYTAMPWSHFIVNPEQHLRSNFSLSITNLDRQTHPYSYRYFIQDENGANVRNYSGGNWNIEPFSISGYQQYQPHANPILVNNPLPTNPAEERHFNIVHVLRAGVAGDSRPRNDTVVYRQSFQNFFSYDDGVPEAGYGVIGRYPRIANQYVAGKPDDIHSVDIYFNHTVGEGNSDRPFKIMIWKQIGPSEEVLYQSDDQLFTGFEDDMNQFMRYELETTVEVADTFYIGIEQQGDIDVDEFISIGFDTGNDASDKLFYNSSGEWMQSIYKGALMIRPVLGINKNTVSTNEPPEKTISATIHPNPVSGNTLTLGLHNNEAAPKPIRIDIIDVYGRMHYSGDYKHMIDVGQMLNGVYFLRIIHPAGKSPETIPFVIAR